MASSTRKESWLGIEDSIGRPGGGSGDRFSGGPWRPDEDPAADPRKVKILRMPREGHLDSEIKQEHVATGSHAQYMGIGSDQ